MCVTAGGLLTAGVGALLAKYVMIEQSWAMWTGIAFLVTHAPALGRTAALCRLLISRAFV
jgi:hypothetical protein